MGIALRCHKASTQRVTSGSIKTSRDEHKLWVKLRQEDKRKITVSVPLVREEVTANQRQRQGQMKTWKMQVKDMVGVGPGTWRHQNSKERKWGTYIKQEDSETEKMSRLKRLNSGIHVHIDTYICAHT